MPPSQRGTGFINWEDFVNANRGATQRTVDTLAGGVQGAGQRAQDSLGYAQEDFERNLDANTLRFDPNSDKSWDELSRYTYMGPDGLAGDQNFQAGLGEARRASRDSALLANPYGRQELLRQQFGAGKPNYTAGQQRFDSALTGTAGRGRFEQLQKDFGGLLGKYNEAATSAFQRAQQARKESGEAAGLYGAYRNYQPGPGQAQDNQTRPLPPPAPTPAPRPADPRAGNAWDVAEDTKKKARAGFRG
jgi:hypothetical protein